MKPYRGPIELALSVAEFKRLGDLYDTARDARDAAWREYRRKFDVPIVGPFYAWPAWRRYTKAYDTYNETFARFMAFASVHVARLQAMSCMSTDVTPRKEMMQ